MLSVLVPTRGRPHRIREIVTAVAATKSLAATELWFGVDEDDPAWPSYRDAVKAVYGDEAQLMCLRAGNGGMVQGLNEMVRLRQMLGSGTTAWMFMGDDHRPRSVGWDEALLYAATTDTAGPGIAYANDLVQGANLPTQVVIDARIITAIGGIMAPGTLTHLYVDNYWKQLGEGADCLRYCPNVVVEHVHPITGKVPTDAGYERVNAGEMYARDEAALRAWESSGRMAMDIGAVRALRAQTGWAD